MPDIPLLLVDGYALPVIVRCYVKAHGPRLVVTVYSAGGSRAGDRARDYMRQYYGFLGEAKADELAGYVLTSPERVVEAYQELDEAGFDELILLPTSAEIDELAPLERLGQGGAVAGMSR
jgi:hypothetical protein